MNKLKFSENNEFDYDGLYSFLEKIKNDYPIPLTEKQDLGLFLNKIKEYGKVFCVYDNSEVVGAIFFYANNFDDSVAFLTLLGVIDKYRKHGIATKLLLKMFDCCFELNFNKIQLYTHQTNKAAIKFYTKHGFYKIPCDRIGDLKMECLLKEVRK